MGSDKIVFRVHALQRMFQRQIGSEDVRRALDEGEVVADYPEDKPYPSKLVLGHAGSRPLHIVVAYNKADNEKIVVTVYEPEPGKWDADFRRKKK